MPGLDRQTAGLDVNEKSSEIRGAGYSGTDTVRLLVSINTVFKPERIHRSIQDSHKEFKTGRPHSWPSAFSDLTVNDSSSSMKVIIILGHRRTVTAVLPQRTSPCIDLVLANHFPPASPSGPSFSAWPCYSPAVLPQYRNKTQQRNSKRLQKNQSQAGRTPYGSSRPNNWKKAGSPYSTDPHCLVGKQQEMSIGMSKTIPW